jgi:signal transduction histidine kinase
MTANAARQRLIVTNEAGPPGEIESLEIRCRQLQALYARTACAAEKDRARIARLVHDGVAQKLTALSLDLTLLEQALRNGKEKADLLEEISQRLKNVSAHAALAIQLARKITSELHSRTLEEFGLSAALESYVSEFRSRLGLQTSYTADKAEISLDARAATSIFRIAQEALLNAARHAQATRVDVRLSVRSGWLCLQIQDDGCGIDEEALTAPESLGLAEMRERAVQLGGTLKVTGVPAEGTLVVLRLPARPASRPAPGCTAIREVC